jgi:predicted transcriptional regulator
VRELALDVLDEETPMTAFSISLHTHTTHRSVSMALSDLIRSGQVRRVKFREDRPGSAWQIGYLRLPPESIAPRGMIIR